MDPSLERRRGRGRRKSDRERLAVHGLLHDLGHELTTLSYLVEAVRGDVDLPEDSGFRLELLSLEMSRLLDIITNSIQAGHAAEQVARVDLRSLAGQVVRLAGYAQEAEVRLLPGPQASVQASPAMLWRVLSNVIDNGARAAGSRGHVTVAVRQPGETVIEVADDGPGFGSGPAGLASLGLEVVTTLLESCGGRFEVTSPPSGGACVRLVLPEQAAAPAATLGSDRP